MYLNINVPYATYLDRLYMHVNKSVCNFVRMPDRIHPSNKNCYRIFNKHNSPYGECKNTKDFKF